MSILGVIGDILWILALSIMAGASRMAWGKIDKAVAVPMVWTMGGATLWRAPRAVALLLLPTAAFLLSLWLMIGSRQNPTGAMAVILLGLRATLAAILAMLHLAQVRRGLNQLVEEGQIRL